MCLLGSILLDTVGIRMRYKPGMQWPDVLGVPPWDVASRQCRMEMWRGETQQGVGYYRTHDAICCTSLKLRLPTVLSLVLRIPKSANVCPAERRHFSMLHFRMGYLLATRTLAQALSANIQRKGMGSLITSRLVEMQNHAQYIYHFRQTVQYFFIDMK